MALVLLMVALLCPIVDWSSFPAHRQTERKVWLMNVKHSVIRICPLHNGILGVNNLAAKKSPRAGL